VSDVEVEALRGEVATLSGVVAELGGMVQDLAGDIVRFVAQGDPSAVRSWIAVDDPELGRLMLADLAEWLSSVWVRFPGPALPECWAYHPYVVEELWVVMNLHRACFRKGGTWQNLADWLKTYRPAAAERIQKEVGSCELTEHEPGADLDPVDWASVPEADLSEVADYWTGHRRAPYPPSPFQ
jgi:hypothetical protein